MKRILNYASLRNNGGFNVLVALACFGAYSIAHLTGSIVGNILYTIFN